MKFVFRFFGYRRLSLLAAALFAGAVLDMLGILVLFPFIELATAPSAFVAEHELQGHLASLGLDDLHHVVLAVGVGLILFYTLKAAVVHGLSRYQFKVTAGLTRGLTEEMYGRLVRCRYSAFQQFPASHLIGVVYNNPIHATLCMTAVASIANDALFLVMLLILSLYLSPMATLVTVLVLLLMGGTLQFTIVRQTQLLGKGQAAAYDAQHKLAFATITAIKDIKVMGIERHILAENTEISNEVYSTSWKYNLLGSLPRTFLEFGVLVGLCAGIVLFLGEQRDTSVLLPLIGSGIAAVLRVLPSFARMIAAVNSYKFYRQFVDKIIDFYEKTQAYELDVADRSMPFATALEARGIGYAYGDKTVLTDFNLSVPKGHSIGIVGMSGSGKSTLLDLLSGIQEKGAGEFLLDGEPVDPFRTNAIRRMLGYVPQTIALMDDTVAFNVTFSHTADAARLRMALKAASLLGFVNQLPEREQTRVGENGVRLSGGQRQRIGIARALYKDPALLILDEATSAVDNITEEELTTEIRSLAGAKTLIIVAHRLSTIRHCDRIYVIHEGKNAGDGTYDELLASNALFQQLHRQRARADQGNLADAEDAGSLPVAWPLGNEPHADRATAAGLEHSLTLGDGAGTLPAVGSHLAGQDRVLAT